MTLVGFSYPYWIMMHGQLHIRFTTFYVYTELTCDTHLISCVFIFFTFQSNPHDDYTKLRANQKNKRVRSESSDYSASTDCKSELGPIPRTKSRGEHISLHSKWNGIGFHPVILSNSLSLVLVVPTLDFTAIWLWIWTENEWLSEGSARHTRYAVCNGSEK